MSSNKKKGITVKIDADLHAEIRQYLEAHEITMAEFITLAVQNELHPKLNMTEAKNMGNMRTLAFQVPEELFHKIKDYLQRNNISQKDFVIGLIETEIERDLAQRGAMGETTTDYEEMAGEETEAQETVAVSDCENVSDGAEEQLVEQENTDFSDDFGAENKEYESTDEGFEEEQDESEDMGMTMGM